MSEVPYYDYETKNESFSSFVRYVGGYKDIANYIFPIMLFDKDLVGIDPWGEDLSEEVKNKILEESRKNPAYFIREVVRDSAGIPFRMNPGVMAALFCYMNKIRFTYSVPEHRQKDDLLAALFMHNLYKDGESLMNFDADFNISIPAYMTFDTPGNYSRATNLPPEGSLSPLYGKNLFYFRLRRGDIKKVICYTDSNSMLMISAYVDDAPHHELTDFYISEWNEQIFDNLKDIKRCCSFFVYEINYDIIDMRLDIHELFENIVRRGKDQLLSIKMFTNEVLMKRYDDLDILEKLQINEMYGRLLTHSNNIFKK